MKKERLATGRAFPKLTVRQVYCCFRPAVQVFSTVLVSVSMNDDLLLFPRNRKREREDAGLLFLDHRSASAVAVMVPADNGGVFFRLYRRDHLHAQNEGGHRRQDECPHGNILCGFHTSNNAKGSGVFRLICGGT